MQIGIIGLPKSGKTATFNALTKGQIPLDVYANKSNIGVAKVPDTRLDELVGLFKPRSVVSAEVNYLDIPTVAENFADSKGIPREYLNGLQSCDALIVVLRSFDDPSIVHLDGSIDPLRDAENILLELTFSDVGIVANRIQKLTEQLKSAKTAQRDSLKKEQTIWEKVKDQLENNVPIREQSFTKEEEDILVGFQLLTSKPIILAVNIDEGEIDRAGVIESEFANLFEQQGMKVVAICSRLEMELAQMSAESEAEFRDGLGAGESSLERMIRVSYELLGLISFLTVGEDEVRAWEIRRDTVAQKAAGKIHTDIERGFIRAEVVHYSDLLAYGSLAECKKNALLRTEGKDYVVKDGDVMNMLFNV
jgi:GTP-binding protein YchF